MIRDGGEIKGVVERQFADIAWDTEKVQREGKGVPPASEHTMVKTSGPIPTEFSSS